jgi:transposase-like protein
MDETYVKVRGEWKYLYRAVDKEGHTVDFLLRARRNKAATRQHFEKSIRQNGVPETVTIDKSGDNLAALHAVKAELNTPIYKDLPVLASWVEGFVLVCCCVS